MKQLEQIIKQIKIIEIKGNTDKIIENITFDSRKVSENSLFIAIEGSRTDGHKYIDKAIEKGANTIICSQMPEEIKKEIAYIKTDDTNTATAQIAAAFYDYPSKELKLIGITGTNGKTTTATLLYKLFAKMGHKVDLISTIAYYIDGKKIKASHTTPDAITINRMLREMVKKGCEYCFSEVSSHAIAQKRVHALEFAGALFTNISHDHLDYHENFAEYIKVKKTLFDNLPEKSFAISNIDDKNGIIMLQNTKAKRYTYALKKIADFKARQIETLMQGTQLSIQNTEIWTPFIGEFNAYNLLAVYAVAMLSGKEHQETLTQISTLQAVRGRFEIVQDRKKKVLAIIDYAHTPDALKNVLDTIVKIATDKQRIITVVGAGGDRDKSKRPIIARTAVDNSDIVILTSDNPRSEKPEDIIKDMEKGIPEKHNAQIISITDRRQAIKTAYLLSKENDLILIAGKGHETYQEINGIRKHFDDREEIIKAFEA